MYHFLPNQTRELFNNVSFLLLVFVAFIILISFNLNNENKIINYALVKYELDLNKSAVKFFNEKAINENSLIDFANVFADDEVVITDKNGIVLHNSIENVFNKLRPVIKEKGALQKDSKEYAKEVLETMQKNNQVGKYLDYKNEKMFVIIKFNDEHSLFFSKKLPEMYIDKIWHSQLFTILAVMAMVLLIYTTYRVFLIRVVMSDVAKFLSGMRWERENLTGAFTIK